MKKNDDIGRQTDPRMTEIETVYQCPNCRNFNTVIGTTHEHVFLCNCTEPPTEMVVVENHEAKSLRN